MEYVSHAKYHVFIVFLVSYVHSKNVNFQHLDFYSLVLSLVLSHLSFKASQSAPQKIQFQYVRQIPGFILTDYPYEK